MMILTKFGRLQQVLWSARAFMKAWLLGASAVFLRPCIQLGQQVSFREAKAVLKQHCENEWTAQHSPSSDKHLQHHLQATIFQPHTGHCQVCAHLYRHGLSHTADCPCETGPQTPELVLLFCLLHEQKWNYEGRTLHKLYTLGHGQSRQQLP